ncbi:MAG: hypothetical protein QOI74_926 [Micromonosporaceae bacterium]|nr:hypothetical protein [Micromonosporaceae bacterium]
MSMFVVTHVVLMLVEAIDYGTVGYPRNRRHDKGGFRVESHGIVSVLGLFGLPASWFG